MMIRVRKCAPPSDRVSIIRDKDKQAELEASGQTEDLAALNRDPDKAYAITKDKHVEIEYYLSDTSLNAVASSIGKAMEPGGFVDRYLLGKELTPEERNNIREGLDAINNCGSFGGCGGQRQGFNRFNPFSWVVTTRRKDTGRLVKAVIRPRLSPGKKAAPVRPSFMPSQANFLAVLPTSMECCPVCSAEQCRQSLRLKFTKWGR